jgi:hypothetical protein
MEPPGIVALEVFIEHRLHFLNGLKASWNHPGFVRVL